MSEGRAAARYAKATLDFAVEQKAAEAVEKDMRLILDTLDENKELVGVLSSPVVKGAIKKNVLADVFKDSHQITKGVMTTLVDNKRIAALKDVAFKYIVLQEQRKGEDIAYVTTAVPITPALEKQILDQVTKITGNKVKLEHKVDESIIGGFTLRVGDLQYDASVLNKLNGLKREFSNSL